MMKYFIPISDELLLSDTEMKRYRMVPYNPDFILIRSTRKLAGKMKSNGHQRRNRYANN